MLRTLLSVLVVCLCAGLPRAGAADEGSARKQRREETPPPSAIRPARRILSKGLKVSLERMRRYHEALGKPRMAVAEPMEPQPGPLQIPGVSLGEGGVRNIPPPAGAGAGIEGTAAVSSATPPLLDSFPGMGTNGTLHPPDTMAAVGPAHLVSILNIGFAIYDKATGVPVFGPISHQAFWAALGTNPGQPASFPFDPRVLFDQYSGRFVITADGGNQSARITPAWILLAVSDDADPTSGWTLFASRFDTPTEPEWSDYPDLGVGPDRIFVTNNAYLVSDDSFTKARITVVDKAAALAGTYSAFEFREPTGGMTWRAAHAFGPSEANYIVSEGWTAGGTSRLLRVQEILADAGTPYMMDLGFIQVADYGFDVGSPLVVRRWAPQAGCAHTIEPVFPRLMNAVQRGGRIWVTHTVDDPIVNNVAKNEVAWYEIDPLMARPKPPYSTPIQQGRLSHPDRWYLFPSIAVNAQGSVALAFSGSSPTEYVGAYYTTRERGDPPGTFGSVLPLKAGESPFTFGATNLEVSRWGDYSATSVDPVDGLTFWTLQEYADQEIAPGCPTGNTGRFGTWFGGFLLQASLPPPAPSGCAALETGGPPGWKRLAPARSAYEGAAGVAVGERIYVTHGEAQYRGLTADNNIYDRTLAAWGPGAPASVPRRDAAGACVEDAGGQGILFVVGGASASAPLADLELYDPVADSWQAGPPMPVARRGAAAVFVPGAGVAGGTLGSVFVLGGSDGIEPGDGNPLDVNHAYDVEIGSWVARAPLPVPLMDMPAVLLPQSGKILVSGGFDGTSSRSDVLLYDPPADAWSFGAPLPTARSRHAMGLCGGKLFAIGGVDGSGETPVSESYNPLADAWYASEPAMPSASSGAASQLTHTGSEIFVIGTTAGPAGTRYGINDLFTCGSVPNCRSDTDCDDDVACNGAEICDLGSGRCGPGTPVSCTDGNPCSIDACRPSVPLLDGEFRFAPAPGWTHSSRGAADSWHQSRFTCTGGALGSEMYLSNGTLGPSCQFASSFEASQLLSPPVQLPASGPLYLDFDASSLGPAGSCTTSGLADAKDVGITTDGGATYTILNDCFPLTTNGGKLVHHRFDLGAFAGRTIQVIFVFDQTDPSSIGILFAVDNVRVHQGDECLHAAADDGLPCPDGQFCNGDEACTAGLCTPGAPPVCDDLDPCTVDACDPGLGACAFAGPFDSEIAEGPDAVCGTADDNPALFGADATCGTPDDAAGDGTCDELDNCVAEHNPGQQNADNDPRGDACDCLPADARTWSIPGEATGVSFADAQTLVWSPPGEPGAAAAAYDTLRSASPGDFGAGAACVESQDAADTTSTDAALPAPGGIFHYLIRAATACGYGTLGARSDTTPRTGRPCP